MANQMSTTVASAHAKATRAVMPARPEPGARDDRENCSTVLPPVPGGRPHDYCAATLMRFRDQCRPEAAKARWQALRITAYAPEVIRRRNVVEFRFNA